MEKTIKAYMLVFGDENLDGYSAVACPEEKISTNFNEILDRLIEYNYISLRQKNFIDLRDKLNFDIAEGRYYKEDAKTFDKLSDRALWEYVFYDNDYFEAGYYYIIDVDIALNI